MEQGDTQLMRWIDSTDLNNWAPRRTCQDHLPLVIRRLIRATAKNIASILFPAGDAVITPGWDGVLKTFSGTEYLPEGLSVWEIGTSQDIKKKAEKDYVKRTENSLGFSSAEATFIFITPRTWSNKNKWCEEKKKENVWKDVRVYDALVLEEWLEQAPAVGAWLARYVGKYPENGIIALEDWWAEWKTTSSTHPDFTPELVLSGRKEHEEKILTWLRSSNASQITFQSTTIDEVIAFLSTVILGLSEDEREFYLSKSIVVKTSEALRHIIGTIKTSLFVISQFEEIDILSSAVSKGHYVYLPLTPDNTTSSTVIELAVPKRDEFVSALTSMGLSEDDAQKQSRDTGRSLAVLRRRWSGASNMPEWAKGNSARDMIPVLLAGRWEESNEAEKDIIAQIAFKSYTSVSRNLTCWLNNSDSPVIKIGKMWRLRSPVDAWLLLAPFIIDTDLENFCTIVLSVLEKLNPALELEPEDRLYSQIYGKKPLYSKTIRKGIAQTLILIAVYGERAGMNITTTPQAWVDGVVRKLLKDAGWKLWHSISDVLPLIAEASPSSFLDAVESSLEKEEPPIMEMFSETEGVFGPTSVHSNLLWALERLAWSPDLFGRVAVTLAKLTRLAPEEPQNRPSDSLFSMFCLQLPQTYTPTNKRLETLDTLLSQEPEAGWNLILDLICYRGFITDSGKPRWREFTSDTTDVVTGADVQKIIDRILLYVGVDGYRWSRLINHITCFSTTGRKNILEAVSSCINDISNSRNELRNALRKVLSNHRSSPEADWAFPEQELAEFERIYQSLEPPELIDSFCWLFDDQVKLPEGVRDFKERVQEILQHRVKAIISIKENYDIEGLVQIAEKVEDPRQVGITVAEASILDSQEEQNIFLLLEEGKNKLSFVQGYIFHSSYKKGDDWVVDIVGVSKSQNWADNKIINLFLVLPQKKAMWDLLETFNEDIQQCYWEKVSIRFHKLLPEEHIYVIKKLFQVKRFYRAIYTAYMSLKKIPPELIKEVLYRAATEKGAEKIPTTDIGADYIVGLFDILDKSSEIAEEDIAQLEWFYITVLTSHNSNRPPRLLHMKLSDNPEFFVEVIKCVYNSESEEIEDVSGNLPDELIKQRGAQAWKLLNTWQAIPGSESDGKIDYATLKEWVNNARKLCRISRRSGVGDTHIGQVLAFAMPDENGNWPPEPVCKIIDETQSESLDNGFSCGIFNKRGVSSKTLFEGGEQEKMLAEQFKSYASALSTSYPRTAAILTKVAEGYKNKARREDQDASIRDLEY